MKKILLFLSLFVAATMSSRAELVVKQLASEPTAVEDLDANKVYAIFVKQNKKPNVTTGGADKYTEITDMGYLFYVSGRVRVAQLDTETSNANTFFWQISKDADGAITMKHLNTASFVADFNTGTGNESGFGLAGSGAAYTATAVSGVENGYTLKGKAANKAWLNVTTYDNTNKTADNTTALWVAYAEERAATFQFYEVLSVTNPKAYNAETTLPAGTYYIRTYSPFVYGVYNPYLKANGDAMNLGPKSEGLDSYKLWEISTPDLSGNDAYNPDADGVAYYIKNVGSSNYWTTGPNAPLGTTARYYNITFDADKKAWKFNGYVNSSIENSITGKAPVYPTSATAFARGADKGDLMYYELIPANEVKFIYKDSEGNVLFEETGHALVGEAPVAPAYDFYTISSYEPETVEASTKEVVVNCTASLPFEFNKVYRMQLRPGGSPANYNMVYGGTNASTRTATDADKFDANHMWYITKVEGTPYVQLHNIGAGLDKAVVMSTTDKGAVTFATTGTNLLVAKNTTTGGSGFSLQHVDNAACHLNDINGTLGTWNNGGSKNDLGSLFKITEITDADIESIASVEPTDQLGAAGPSEEVKNAAKASKTAVDVAAVLNTPAFKYLVEEGKFYQITFNRAYQGNNSMTLAGNVNAEGKFLDTDEDNAARLVQMTAQAENNVSQLWQFVPVDGEEGTYYLRGANAMDHYLGTPDISAGTASGVLRIVGNITWSGKYTPIAQAYDGNWVLKISNVTDANNYLNASNSSTNITRYFGAFGDGGNIVTFKKVSSVKVAIGTTGYATACFPFATTIPDGVQAYTASTTSEAGGVTYLTLDEVSGTIPAGEGVILTATTPDTYTFDIDYASTATKDAANKLEGVTLKRQGYEADNHYGLKAVGEGVVLAKNAAGVTVPSNKAILPVANVANSEAAQLLISFDGTETGISGVESDKAEDVKFYDLNGRRVKRPTTGVYVTDKGRKVFVK